MPDTTICIPIFNGSQWLEKLLGSIYTQKVNFKFNILCVDSGSTDNSIQIINKFKNRGNLKLEIINNEEFGHGRTRNMIVDMVNTKYTLLITQDILPTSNDWLQKIHDSLSVDEKIAAVFCRHKAWPTSHPVQMRYIKKTFDDYLLHIKTFASYKFINEVSYFTNKDDIKVWDKVTAFSNVCAIYRTDVIKEIKFEEVDFAEDRRFMKTAIEMGYYIGYLDNTSIYHSHDYGYWGTLMRTVDEWKAIAQHGHFPYRFRIWHIITQSIIGYLRDIQFCLFSANELTFLRRIAGLFTCLLMEVTIKTGMYIGLNHEYLPKSLVSGLSYQKNWREDKIK